MYQEDKTKWSYLAGMIDGEGCISLWKTKARGRKNCDSFYKTYDSFNLRIQIYNTSLPLMKWLIKNFGGVFHTRLHSNDRHKTSYSWRPKGAGNTKKLLLGTLPYLVIKEEQAKLALKYIELPCGSFPQRDEIYRRMRLLNQKGKTVTTNTLDDSDEELKIESKLTGDRESDPAVTQDS